MSGLTVTVHLTSPVVLFATDPDLDTAAELESACSSTWMSILISFPSILITMVWLSSSICISLENQHPMLIYPETFDNMPKSSYIRIVALLSLTSHVALMPEDSSSIRSERLPTSSNSLGIGTVNISPALMSASFGIAK